ncbi:unnamed protein product [Schistocephalus solidus]|uniref:Reverse transcriptase domain-containing protein n=1 Tax=Schistocephalus solidus TaxID=70667 RepID=A0A183SG54_SCHSO|nr:unnamed protein product [Schistocephalus solidus]
MQDSTRMSTTTIHDLLFVDDCALNTVTEEDMQRSMDLFAAGCADFGLTISTAKAVVVPQPPPSMEYNALRINVNGAQLKNVETFAYLGSTLSRNTRIDDEVAQRISKASQTFGRLQAFVWNHHAPNIVRIKNPYGLATTPPSDSNRQANDRSILGRNKLATAI